MYRSVVVDPQVDRHEVTGAAGLQHNPVIKARHERKRAAGKSKMNAVGHCMRRGRLTKPDVTHQPEAVSQPSMPSIVEPVAAEIRAHLGDQLVGLYLYGSAATGGFDAHASDIDLVAVTVSEIGALDLADLERMHAAFVTGHPSWDDRIEVTYVGQATLRAFRAGGALAVISPGEPLHRRDDAERWLQNWYLVRETGMTLYGPGPGFLVPPISRAEFLASVARYADEVRQRDLRSMTPGARAYAVLTTCRARRTIATGTTCSKQEGAAGARVQVPEWAWLIDAALACRLAGGRAGFDDEPTLVASDKFMRRVAAETEKVARL